MDGRIQSTDPTCNRGLAERMMPALWADWSEGGSECSARSGPPERDLLQLTPVHACVVRGRGEPMGLPASPGGLVLVPLSVSVPQLLPAKNDLAPYFCANVRKWHKK